MAKVFIDKNAPNLYRKLLKANPLLGSNRTAVQSKFIAATHIPHWKEICKTLQKVDIRLEIEYDMLGENKCKLWAECAEVQIASLNCIEHVSIRDNNFHKWLEVKFKYRDEIYLFDRTIAQFSSRALFYRKDRYDPTLEKFARMYGYYGLKSAAPEFYKKHPAVPLGS